MKTENIPNHLVWITKEQKKIGIIASIPPGFQNGTDNRHNPIVNKNGKEKRKNSVKLFFICIRFQVYQILKS